MTKRTIDFNCVQEPFIGFGQGDAEDVATPKVAEMTAGILRSGGFWKEAERDLAFSLEAGQTIAEVHGCTAFCNKTLEHAVPTPEVLAPSRLRDQEKVNEVLALALRYKRMGHAFNLAGTVKLPDGSSISLEGFNETFVWPMLRAMFDAFSSDQKDQEICDFVKASLLGAVWHDNVSDQKIDEILRLIHDPSHPYPVVVGSGWIWHSTQVIFFGDYLFYCNRGDDSNEDSGITILKIKNKEKITPEFLKKIASRLSVEHSEYMSLEKIQEELGVESVKHLYMKAQKVGNCTYVNAKSAIFALLLIAISKREAEKSGKAISFNRSNLRSAKQIYKAFSQFDKEEVLRDFLIDLQKAHQAEQAEKRKDYLEGLNAVAALFRSWAMDHLKDNKKIDDDLMQMALILV
jgi:hypothetical protein